MMLERKLIVGLSGLWLLNYSIAHGEKQVEALLKELKKPENEKKYAGKIKKYESSLVKKRRNSKKLR